MSDTDFRPGLEGVIAFESMIAEPDKEGGALRYRGVDINDLVGRVPFGHVWGLLVDNEFNPGLPPAEPFPLPVHTGDVRVDVQSALAQLAPVWGFRPMLDIDAEQVRGVLAAIAPIVGTARVAAATGKIVEALAAAIVSFFGGPPPEAYGPVPRSPSKAARQPVKPAPKKSGRKR